MGSSFDVDGDDYHDTFMIVAKMHFCLSDHQPCRPRHHRRARDQQGEGGSDLSATWEPHTGQELRKVPIQDDKENDDDGEDGIVGGCTRTWIIVNFPPVLSALLWLVWTPITSGQRDKKYLNIVINWDNILKK